jgi:hypothetical protein
MKTYTIDKYGITVNVCLDGGVNAGSLVSELTKHVLGDEHTENEFELKGAVNAIEALIVAHACEGIDVASKAYVAGLDTALEAIANNYC